MLQESEKEIHQEPGEKKEIKEPKISFQILYSSHRTAKDIEKLAEIFPKCNIYVPEGCGWAPKILADFQALSQGEKTPQELKQKYGWPEDSPWTKIWEIIYQSQKPILFADLGEGHELEEIDRQADALFRQSFEEFKGGNFQEAIQIMRDSLAKYAEHNQKREEIIRANLETKIKEIIENNPQLKNKKEIKVLLTLGSAHTRFFHSLKKEKPSTAWQFASLPNVFLSRDETTRRLMFSKEVNDELLAKIFIEQYLYNYFKRITDDTNKIKRLIRKISSQIFLNGIKNLSENWTDERSGGLPLILRKFFKNKGIKIPETKEEIDEMLKEK